MTDSIHLRRLASRVTRTGARLVAHAEQGNLGVADLVGARLPWYAVRANAGQEVGDDESATVFVFDEIGGSFGVDAGELVRELETITAPTIRVRINSPGGSVFDAVAIHSALRHHPAKVITYVDALAASAASVIAIAGDEVVMMPGSQMMIHDASAVLDGNPREMAKMATFLDRQSDNIADLYRQKGGGDVAAWRALMGEETWMFAAEAVQMGLADRAETYDLPAAEPDLDEAMARSHDLDRFGYHYPGRAYAPVPRRPYHTPARPPQTRRGRGDNTTDVLHRLGETI